MSREFVHLHLHTEYSLLDGFARIDSAVAFAKEHEMPALGITDHGTMFGVIDFYRACQSAGVKPIIGVEAYLARRGMEDRDPKQDTSPYHMLLLAKNQQGYQNLLKLSSEAQLRGYYYRPRIDRELMAQYSEGIIATSGCLAAEIPRMVELGQDDKARELIGWYQDVFGPENFFLELQSHDIDLLDTLNAWLLDNAGYANVPLLATNDVHYVREEDYDFHDTLLCIQTGNLKQEEKRLRMTDNSYFMRSPQQMWDIFGDVAPESLSNSLLIADMCEVDLDHKGYHLPVFPVPPNFETPGEYLRYLCERGLQWRFGDSAWDDRNVDRLNHELNIIGRMGFDTYFLIVWDLCEFARHKDIWWNVRGSGAGSLVAYTLGITNLDPMENGLIFERFLNPGRVSMPDFDLDYPEDRRAEMIEYCTRKYGEDKVAAIITFGTLGAKAAIRDVGRALDIPLTDVDRIAKTIPAVAKVPKIPDMLGDKEGKAVPELKEIYKANATAKRIIDIAAKIEGVPRHASTHAAGVIVSDRPLVEYVPLHRITKGDADDNPVKMVTQFPMETAESIGLLKVDFLGLSTLTVLRKACDLIEEYHGIKFDMSNIPIKPDPDDPEITQRVEEMFEMMGKGHTIGVFQLESAGMRQMLTGMRPKTFEHVIAGISLYRPGPMEYIPLYNSRMHGAEPVHYHHPMLEPILSNTYGILVYQEQIMQVAAELFGYELGEADLMRRAVSKKKEKELKKHRATFLERGPDFGVDAESAGKIFDDIEFFARYGFNKSHAADYAVISCQTAYLKCHYPHEFMSALMSVYYDQAEKVSLFIADCRRIGIKVLPPSVNKSQLDFSIEQDEDDPNQRDIRFGLGAVKNLGVGPIEYILEQRGNVPFENLDDFLKRCDMREIGKRALESLIRVGGLDEFGNRAVLLANLEKIAAYSAQHHKNAAVGQVSMFDLMTTTHDQGSVASALVEVPQEDWDYREQLRWERDLIGLYISDHPLNAIWTTLESEITHTSSELKENIEIEKGRDVRIAGLINEIRTITTKNDRHMAVIKLEDIQGMLEVVFFPRIWERHQELVADDRVLIVYGKADLRGNDAQVIASMAKTNITTREAVEDLSYLSQGLQLEDDPEEDPFDEETGEMMQAKSEPAPPKAAVMEPATQGANVFPYQLEPQLTEVIEEPEEVREMMAAHAVVGEPAHIEPPMPHHTTPAAAPQAFGQKSSKLIIVMERTGDLGHDRRRLRRIHNLAAEFPGHDHFCVIFETADQRRLQMDFPNLGINIDKAYEQLRFCEGVLDLYPDN